MKHKMSSGTSATTTTSGLSSIEDDDEHDLSEDQQQLNSHRPLSTKQDSNSSNSSKKEATTSFYQKHCYFLVPMLGWFVFSALLSSYNKVVFGGDNGNSSSHNNATNFDNTTPVSSFDDDLVAFDPDHVDPDTLFDNDFAHDNNDDATSSSTPILENKNLAFPCPLLMTSLHFAAQWVFAETLCALWPRTWGSHVVSQMSWKDYRNVAVPCGLVTALDIGLSNLSWVTLSLTLYTMIKSCTPVFVLFWAYVFGIARITWQLILVVALITLGEYIVVGGKVHEKRQANMDILNEQDQEPFPWHGVVLCLCAAVLSGARWTLVQLKIQNMQPPITSTIATMRLLAPSMFWSMLIISLVLERPWERMQMDMATSLQMACLGLIGGVFAIAMILCEFFLILKANAIILAIGGVVKEVVTIWIGILLFGDAFTLQSLLGCTVIFAGILLYKFTFKKTKPVTSNSNHKASPIWARHASRDLQGEEEEAGLLKSHQQRNKNTKHMQRNRISNGKLERTMSGSTTESNNAVGIEMQNTNTQISAAEVRIV